MRIIGRIPHPTLQITVFSNDGRFPVQFETDGLTQIYRFRHAPALRNLKDIEELISGDFTEQVLETFAAMRATHRTALKTLTPPPTPLSDLPDIL